MAVSITKLKSYFMSRINQDDVTVVEMVDRYLTLLKVFRDAEKAVMKSGTQVEVKNGAQEYTKSNPLISDMKNINAQLINLKKDIDKHIAEFEKSKPKEDKRSLI